jgi:hypothetical protein
MNLHILVHRSEMRTNAPCIFRESTVEFNEKKKKDLTPNSFRVLGF